MTWLPDHNEVKSVHEELTRIFEKEEDPISPPGVKSQNLLESACSRPHTGLGGHDKYTTLEDKAAALFHSLTKNHAFHNGNKRTALVTTLTVLHRNDRILNSTVTDDSIYDFVVAVTANEFPEENHGLDSDGVVSNISHWIKSNSEPITTKISDMKTTDFVKKCQQAGANVKESKGGSYVISRNMKSIRISKSTRQLSGNSIRTYLRNLGISESASGVTFGEFQDGINDERSQIRRYMVALKRLAKT
jgi:death-on-curing family protein